MFNAKQDRAISWGVLALLIILLLAVLWGTARRIGLEQECESKGGVLFKAQCIQVVVIPLDKDF